MSIETGSPRIVLESSGWLLALRKQQRNLANRPIERQLANFATGPSSRRPVGCPADLEPLRVKLMRDSH